jgi:hypothetical protein
MTIGSRSNVKRSGRTRTRLKRAVVSTILRVVTIVITQAARTTKTYNRQSGGNCTQHLPTRI